MIDINKIGIVIQGPIYGKFCTEQILEKYGSISKNCVISTWNNQDLNLIDELKENGFRILLDEKPIFKGHHNCNLQTKSSSNGINLLYKLGFTHSLRMRSDLIPNDIVNFIDTLSKISMEKIIFLCWINNENCSYFADFFNFGPTNKLLKFWDVLQDENDPNSNMFTEQYLCYRYTDIKYPKYEDIKKFFTFSINELYNNKVQLNWIKPGRDWGEQVYRYMFSPNNEILKSYYD